VGILERLHNLQQARYDGDMDDGDVTDSDVDSEDVIACLPTNADYPLLRVHCIVSFNCYNLQIFY
jgi:hypothetical protein